MSKLPDLRNNIRFKTDIAMMPDSREKDIVLRYLEGETMQSIGKSYEVSRERIRQMILSFLQYALAANKVRKAKAQGQILDMKVFDFAMGCISHRGTLGRRAVAYKFEVRAPHMSVGELLEKKYADLHSIVKPFGKKSYQLLEMYLQEYGLSFTNKR